MKISTASGKLLETHHMMFSGLMSWRLPIGLYKLHIEFTFGVHSKTVLIIL